MAASQSLRDDFVEIELDLQRDVLQTLHGDLVHGIRAVDVCSKLFTVGLLTEREQSDILAQASHSPHDATEIMVSALRRLHRGKETSSILYRVLKEIRGYQDIAERIRQAFLDRGVEISATASVSVPSPRSPVSSETPPSALPTPVQVSTSDRPQSRPLDELLQTTVKQGAPTPPKSVCVPSQVDYLLTEFAHLVARVYEIVCDLPRNKLKSLRKLLATLLRQHSLSEEVVVGETGEEVAEIVTSGDQDIINHSWLKESVRIIADPDLLKLYGEFNDMLKQHKEKCISSTDVFPKQNPLCPPGEARSVLEIGHKQKSQEEFLFEHVLRELSFLKNITGSERVRFEGFRSGSVYLYFSMPKEVEYILVSEIVRNLEWFVEWGVTNVTVYDFFTLNLEVKAALTVWRTEIDLRRRHELEEAKIEVEGLKMSHHNKSKLTGVKKFAGTRSLSGVGSSVRKMDKELQETRKLLEESTTEAAKTIQQLEEKVEALQKKLSSPEEGGTSSAGSTEQISRQAFQNAERPASQAESEELPLPQLATTDNDSFSGITFSQSQVTHREIVSPERQFVNHVHSPPVPGEVPPTPPELVYEPSDVKDLKTLFAHLMGKAYVTVCRDLSPGQLGGLSRFLSFDKGVNIEENDRIVAKLVTSTDQDFVNHCCLSESIKMIDDPDLSRMHKEYEAKLEDQKTKCIYNRHIKSLPMRIDLTFDVRVDSVLRMGHKEKLPEEFQLDHVITELNFLQKVTGTTEVKFKGFSTERGNVVSPAGVRRSTGTSESRVCTESCSLLYLCFSLPQQAALHFYRDNIPTLLESMRSFAAAGHLMCGVTNVTVYGSRYCTFDLPT